MRTAKLILNSLVMLSTVCLTLFTALVSSPIIAQAQTVGVPNTLGYQGRLLTSSDVAVDDGTYDFRFNFYAASTGGTALNASDIDVDDVTVTNGYFTAPISMSGEVDLFANNLFLEVSVKEDSEGSYDTMTSRVALSTTAYAQFARAVENATTNPSTDLFAGRTYFNTSAGDMRVYNGSSWTSLTANLDDAYDNFGSDAQIITVDDASTGIEFSVEAAGNYTVDLQSTGDLVVQDAGSTWAQFTDAQVFDVDGTGAISLDAGGASNFNTSSGDLSFDAEAGSVVIDGGEAAADAIRIVASNAAGGLDIDAGSGGFDIDSTGEIQIDGELVDIGGGTYTTADGDNDLGVAGDFEVLGTLMVNSGSLDVDGAADFSSGVTNSAGELLVSGGNVQLNDSIVLSLGTGDDFSLTHNGTNTVITSATGNLQFDNTTATGATLMTLGTDTSATSFVVENNTTTDLFTIDGAGLLDVHGNQIDLDADNDTSITADTDDQIDIELGGGDEYVFTTADFQFGVNNLNGTNFDVTGSTGDVITAGDLAVNGDDITADGALDISATGAVRIGDTATADVASSDDALFVEGVLEVDGEFELDGALDADSTSDFADVVTISGGGLLLEDDIAIGWGAEGDFSSYFNPTNGIIVFDTDLSAAASSTEEALFTFAYDYNDDDADTANQEIFEIGRDGDDDSSGSWTELFAIDAEGDIVAAGDLTLTGGDVDLSFEEATFQLRDNTSNALDFDIMGDNYFVIDSTNSSEAMSFGNATTNPTYSFAGSGTTTFGGDLTITGGDVDLSFEEATFQLRDNTSNAFDFDIMGDNYFVIDSTNSSEAMSFGNASTNPTYSFLGTGSATFGGSVVISGGNIDLDADSSDITIGAGDDLVLSHDGTNSTISNAGGEGDLIITNAGTDSGEDIIIRMGTANSGATNFRLQDNNEDTIIGVADTGTIALGKNGAFANDVTGTMAMVSWGPSDSGANEQIVMEVAQQNNTGNANAAADAILNINNLDANSQVGAGIVIQNEGGGGYAVGIDAGGFGIDLDADNDTSITADTDDQIDFEIAGSDQIVFQDAGSAGHNATVSTAEFNVTTAAHGSGTNIDNGVFIDAVIGDATAGSNTTNLLFIGANDGTLEGDAGVDVNAINIGNFSGTGAEETAIVIGTGWDTALEINSGDIVMNDNQSLIFGDSDDLTIYHDGGGDTYFTNTSGQLIFENTDATQPIVAVLGDSAGNTAFAVENSDENFALMVGSEGSLVQGLGTTTTSKTTGFLYLNTVAGAPTGDADPDAGYAAITYDTTNNDICVHEEGAGGTWVCSAALADFAEWMPAVGASPGEIVVTTSKSNPVEDETAPFMLATSSESYADNMVGIVSVWAEEMEKAHGRRYSDDYRAVALAGRVPLKVNAENGSIFAGDYLTSSSTPGVAMKATQAGHVVGMALEDWDGTSEMIVVEVMKSWYEPSLAASLQGGEDTGTELAAGSISSSALVVSGDAEFQGSVTVEGPIYASRDTAGRARLNAGDLSVRVNFEEEYTSTPIVTFSLRSEEYVHGKLWVSDEDETGFTINHSAGSTTAYDLEFNWIAIGVEEGIVSVSDGSEETFEGSVQVVGSSEEEVSEETTEEVESEETTSEEETVESEVSDSEETVSEETPSEEANAEEGEEETETGEEEEPASASEDETDIETSEEEVSEDPSDTEESEEDTETPSEEVTEEIVE